MIAISILFYTHWKGSEISSLSKLASFVQQFNRISGQISGYPASRISGKWNRISDWPTSRISGTTLQKSINIIYSSWYKKQTVNWPWWRRLPSPRGRLQDGAWRDGTSGEGSTSPPVVWWFEACSVIGSFGHSASWSSWAITLENV